MLQGETPNINLQQGSYSVQLEATGLKGTTRPLFNSTTVNVKDILIVAIGDSYASGEGTRSSMGITASRRRNGLTPRTRP